MARAQGLRAAGGDHTASSPVPGLEREVTVGGRSRPGEAPSKDRFEESTGRLGVVAGELEEREGTGHGLRGFSIVFLHELWTPAVERADRGQTDETIGETSRELLDPPLAFLHRRTAGRARGGSSSGFGRDDATLLLWRCYRN